MKFGKRLSSEASRHGEQHYIDYKACKKAIQQDVSGSDLRGHEFLTVLQQQLQRVSQYYSAQEAELEAAFPQQGLTSPAEMDAFNLRATDLRKFVILNYVACIKAVKKRNRHLAAAHGGTAGHLHANALLSQQPFFTSPKLAALQTRAELLAQGMPGEGRRQAREYDCPICLATLHMPVVLTCAHRFCWACLLSHCSSSIPAGPGLQSSAKDGKPQAQIRPEPEAGPAMYACPVCRKDHILDLDRLQVDPHLHAYVENLKRQEGSVEAPAVQTLHQAQPPPAVSVPKSATASVDSCTSIPAGGALAAAAESESLSDDAEESTAAVVLPTPEPGMPSLLPPQAEHLKGRMTVVLDLDGTLVSSFTPSRAPRLPPGMVSYVVGRGQKLNPGGVFVIERPGLQDFLKRINEFAEVVLFTAGLEDYAQPILDRLQQRYACFQYRLYRPATSASRSYPCIKDLSRLGRPLARTLLVDDTPLAFVRQPHNGLPVLTFRGDPDDRVLMEALLPVLESLAQAADVRPALQRRFNMQRWFSAQGLDLEQQVQQPAAPPRSKAVHPAPRSLPPRHSVPSAPRTLLLFDFDKTLVNWDAGERLVGELAPELLPMLASLQMPANFVPLYNTVLAEMARRGITRDALLATLHKMASEVPAAAVRMLEWASRSACDVRVVSDCNSVFISSIIKGAKLGPHVREVITNEATFQRCEDDTAAPSVGGSSQARHAASHRLVIEPRRAYEDGDEHGCSICPANMCKGAEVASLLEQQRYRRTVYVGDGENDLCPALTLSAGDLVLARKGHGLERLLGQPLPKGRMLQASVRLWGSHAELAELLRKHA